MTIEEKSLAKWHIEKVKESRQYFQYADLILNTLESQKDDDLLIIQDWLTEVHNKLKLDDERRNEILKLIQGIWRIEKYCGAIETSCKSASVILFTSSKRIEELESELRISNLKAIQDKYKYESQISKLEKEIEFITKSSKP